MNECIFYYSYLFLFLFFTALHLFVCIYVLFLFVKYPILCFFNKNTTFFFSSFLSLHKKSRKKVKRFLFTLLHCAILYCCFFCPRKFYCTFLLFLCPSFQFFFKKSKEQYIKKRVCSFFKSLNSSFYCCSRIFFLLLFLSLSLSIFDSFYYIYENKSSIF